MATMLQSGVASAERVFELLDAEEQEPETTVDTAAAGIGAATAAIAALPVDQPPAWLADDMPPYSTLRELLLHVIVETSTHAGHLDICRELVDGGQRLVLDVPD